jgi:hypothetical protein
MSRLSPVYPVSADLWAAQVAAHATLPDQRLNARWASVLACLAAKPADSIPQSAGNWAQAKATYRFLDNERVQQEALLMSLVRSTVQSSRQWRVIYAIHDSTSFNYSSLKRTTGLGLLNDCDEARGIHLHSTLALRPDGVALGLLHQSYWVRPPEEKSAKSRQRPLEERESFKWLAGVAAVEQALTALSAADRPRVIHLMDREGDIHEVLEYLDDGPDGAVIRCCHNRKVDGQPDTAVAAVQAAPLLGITTVTVKASPTQPARQAQLALRSVTVELTPTAQKRQRRPVKYTLVEAKEVEYSTVVTEPLHWLLWTTEPATTLAEAQAVVRIYTFRPRIEDFHLTLKSGCQVERLELETAQRLEKALVAYSGVAVRIVALRDLARQEPEASCEQVLGRDEWHVLWIHFRGETPTRQTRPPSVLEVVKWIGRLGGHLGRKRDGMPGVRVLWRGWRDLQLLVAGYRAGQQQAAPGR